MSALSSPSTMPMPFRNQSSQSITDISASGGPSASPRRENRFVRTAHARQRTTSMRRCPETADHTRRGWIAPDGALSAVQGMAAQNLAERA